jgi:hypothetical protein
MTFRIVRGALADAEIDDFGRYAADYSEEFAREQFTRLNRIFAIDLAEAPNTWGYFYITGAPYRAYLFRVGRRTIIYAVDDDAKIANVLRFWNASREPESFET